MTCPDCGHTPGIGEWPLRCKGSADGHALGRFWKQDASIHQSEKVVVFRNAQGEVRIPGRADRPMPEKYAAAGFVREELSSVAEIRKVEKQKGLIHESSNYDSGSAAPERDTGVA